MNQLRITKVLKTGNSLSIVIPREVRDALGIQRGDQMSFGIYSDDVICIRKISHRDLLKLKPQQSHASLETDNN